MSGKLKGNDAISATQDAMQESGAIAARGFEQTVAGLKDSASSAAGAAGQASEQIGGKVREGMDQMMKRAERMASFSQGNVDAMMRSGQIWTAGLQDLGREIAANAQASLDEGMSAFRALTGVKSLREAIELQTSFARTAMEKAMAESSRLTETSLKLAEQASAPLNARVNAAAEAFSVRS